MSIHSVFSEEEDKMILDNSISTKELSARIGKTKQQIWSRRNYLKALMPVPQGDTFLTQKRKELGIGTYQLGQMLGVSQSMASNYLTGRHSPDKNTAKKICEILNIDPKEGNKYFKEAKAAFKRKNTDKNKTKADAPVKSEENPSKYKERTWWNQKRLETQFNIKDIAQYTDRSEFYIGEAFNGYLVPTDKTIRKLCEFYDVDFEEGRAHFIEDNKLRHLGYIGKKPPEKEEKKITVKTKDKPSKKVKIKSKKEVQKPQNNVESKPETKTNVKVKGTVVPKETNLSKDKILKELYKEVSFDVFMKVADAIDSGDIDKITELVYGKVSFDSFRAILRITADNNGLATEEQGRAV